MISDSSMFIVLCVSVLFMRGLSGKSVTPELEATETTTGMEVDSSQPVGNETENQNSSDSSTRTSGPILILSSNDQTFVPSALTTTMMDRYNLTFEEGQDYEEIDIEPVVRQKFAKQIGLPSNPIGMLVSRVPCHCQSGVCGCCTGLLFAAFRSKGCMNLTYIPEDFAFEVKMMMNDAVLYKNKLSGRNPRPICVNPPRFNFIELCANFYDIYFVGRNMHVCLEMNANFQGYELFNRSFDCMRLGDQGVKIVKPEEGGGLPYKPSSGTDADVDSGDDIEDYDENLLREIAVL